jgi:hypothetical protein
MNAILTTAIITVCLCGAVVVGMLFSRRLPDHHLSSETKDAVKVAMGLIATMSALLLGLLVSSAKGSYDTVRSEVIQLSAKISFFDRVLSVYGPEAAPLRTELREVSQNIMAQMWSADGSATGPDIQKGNVLYAAIQGLSPRTDVQRAMKDQAAEVAVEIAQIRTLLQAQSMASVSLPLLVVVVCWLMIIFFNFSLFAPPNATATAALLIAAISVAGALFLILEMDQPFSGLIRISSEPMVNALGQM